MTITDNLYRHLYPDALRAIINSLHEQVRDSDEFGTDHTLDDEEIEDREYMRSELKKVLQIYVNYNTYDTEMNEFATEYGITKNNNE